LTFLLSRSGNLFISP